MRPNAANVARIFESPRNSPSSPFDTQDDVLRIDVLFAMPDKQDRYPFHFLRMNRAPEKPRSQRITEIRGPYYSVLGRRYLEDVLETMG